ncbi:flagellar biosynthetic protein FliR [Liquorilactobacillus satsumensis]|uniref:flagellar biosynthetic protein FliR n=1 Tax=Liquorilactobacillus satsumensis TaxID=259059 RepID=UPI0039ECD2BD
MVAVELGALLLCRIASFLAISPVFSQRGFPNLAKIVVGGSLVIAAYPAVGDFKEISSLLLFGVIALKEILFGLAMGYLSQLVFSGVMMAGEMIDFQVGFSMAQAYDTTMEVAASQFGKLYYWLTLAVFFMLNLHHQLILGLMESFKIVPLGTAVIKGTTVEGVVELFEKTVVMALSLAAPLVIAVLIIDIVLGVISRSIPQINILMLSLSIKTAVAILLFLLVLPNLLDFLANNIAGGIANILDFVKASR